MMSSATTLNGGAKEMSDAKKRRIRNEAQLTSLFQACLRDLGLPLEYLHTKKGKGTDFKRQQVGVRMKEAYDLGRKHAEAEFLDRIRKELNFDRQVFVSPRVGD